MKTKFLFLLTFLFAYSFMQAQDLNENENKIQDLRKELVELDKMLGTVKSQGEEKEAILDNSDLDDETKNYIRRIVGDYMDASVAKKSDLAYLSGQMNSLQTSLEGLKKNVYSDNASINNKIDDLSAKIELSQGLSTEDVAEIKTDIIGLKAQVNAMNMMGASSDGDNSSGKDRLIIQQEQEIALLKEEVKKLKTQLETANSNVRFTSTEEYKTLKYQNLQYQQVIKDQQDQIVVLNAKVDMLEEQVRNNDEIKALASKVENLEYKTEEVQKTTLEKINRDEIEESILGIDVIQAQSETNRKIDNINEDLKNLKSMIARGEVNEVTGQPLLFNASSTGQYHIIVASRRTEEAIKIAQDDFAKQGYPTQIVQNSSKSWYHLSAERKETRTDAGKKVSDFRTNGFNGAWWLYLKN